MNHYKACARSIYQGCGILWSHHLMPSPRWVSCTVYGSCLKGFQTRGGCNRCRPCSCCCSGSACCSSHCRGECLCGTTNERLGSALAVVSFDWATLQLLMAELTNSFEIALKVRPVMCVETVQDMTSTPNSLAGVGNEFIPSVTIWVGGVVVQSLWKWPIPPHLQQAFDLAWLSFTCTSQTHSSRLSEPHCSGAPMETYIILRHLCRWTPSARCHLVSDVSSFSNTSSNVSEPFLSVLLFYPL